MHFLILLLQRWRLGTGPLYTFFSCKNPRTTLYAYAYTYTKPRWLLQGPLLLLYSPVYERCIEFSTSTHIYTHGHRHAVLKPIICASHRYQHEIHSRYRYAFTLALRAHTARGVRETPLPPKAIRKGIRSSFRYVNIRSNKYIHVWGNMLEYPFSALIEESTRILQQNYRICMRIYRGTKLPDCFQTTFIAVHLSIHNYQVPHSQ